MQKAYSLRPADSSLLLRHDEAGQAVGKVERGTQVFEQAFMRKVAQVLEQVPVETEPTEGRQANAKRWQ